jgi:DNA replication protein DnaC
VKFGTLAEYLAGIRATYNQEAEVRTDRYIEQLTYSYLLCIDDLGKERLTQWAQEQLFLIVNARYNLRPQGHMILTSNAEGQGLAASTGIHNWSRLQEIGTVVYMKGSDYRLRGKK